MGLKGGERPHASFNLAKRIMLSPLAAPIQGAAINRNTLHRIPDTEWLHRHHAVDHLATIYDTDFGSR